MKSKLTLMLAILLCLSGLYTASVQAQTICNNESGSQGGYTYEYWKDNGNGCMVLGSGGTFSIEWSNIGNLLARKGLRPGSTNQVVNYGANYQPNGNSYLCVYGWTTNPLVEYYIVESWGSWRPPGSSSKGTVTIDGGTYDIYETTRTNQPSIEGTRTFQQYWSVRTSKKTSGTIHVGQHFSAWANKGMQMGSLYEVSFTVEGYQSSGTCDVYSMSMTTGYGDDDDDDDDNGGYTTTRSAFSTIQAEQYYSKSSSDIEAFDNGEGGQSLGYIESGDTITYQNIDFGSGTSSVSFRVGSEQNTNIQIRLGSASGTLIGTISDCSTGGWDTYQNKSTTVNNVTGLQNVVLVFSGPVNIDSFIFTGSSAGDDDDDYTGGTRSAFSNIQAEQYNSVSSSSIETFDTPDGGQAIGYIESGNTATYQDIDFGSGASSATFRVASEQNTNIQIRLGNSSGTLIGTISDCSTGGWDTYQNKTTTVSNVTGLQTVVLVFSGPVNFDSFVFSGSYTGDDDDDDDDYGSFDAFSNIQAEDYSSTTSATIEDIGTANGGSGIGYIESGDTVTFNNVNFGSGASSFKASVASEQSTNIQIRLGSSSGTLIGTLSNCSTGGWDTYQDKSTSITSTSGIHNVVLVFSGPVNVDYFTFSTGSGDNPTPTGKLIALTFDDGPNNSITPQVLDKLQQNGIVASFFLIGQNVNSGVQSVMQRQLSLGCEINNHSYTHSDMTSFSSWDIQQEIQQTNSAINQQVGVTPKFFRPPYIAYNNTMFQAIDLPFINGINCNDWDSSVSATTRAQTIINNAQDGDIVLLHDYDGNYNTVQALDSMIQGLKNKGFSFVTVTQLFNAKGVNPNQEYKIWSNVYN